MHGYFLMTRAMTLGVRAAAFDADGRVFLVRHSYVPGWHMPGGGVERFETVRQALEKELREEGNLGADRRAAGLRRLLQQGHQPSRSRRLLSLRRGPADGAEAGGRRNTARVASSPLDALPQGVTAATRRRLAELAGECHISHYW